MSRRDFTYTSQKIWEAQEMGRTITFFKEIQPMVTPHEARVLNLIARVNIQTASAKKRQIIHLLKKWPSARGIRFSSKCHCRRGNQLSFTLPEYTGTHMLRGELHEECGFWCPHCGFSNAGGRPVGWERGS